MTQEKIQLLIKELCTRLPYGVMCQVDVGCAGLDDGKLVEIDTEEERVRFADDGYWDADIDDVKPYLRPMEDMTVEEYEELRSLCSIYIPSDSRNIGFEDYGILVFTNHLTNNTYTFKLNMKVINWLNAHHFDYDGLIEKGLAIKAPKGMYEKK